MYITVKYTAVQEVYKHDETYKSAGNIQNCNHILRDVIFFFKFTFRKQYDTVRITTAMCTLVSFKYWCIDSLKMAEFHRNM